MNSALCEQLTGAASDGGIVPIVQLGTHTSEEPDEIMVDEASSVYMEGDEVAPSEAAGDDSGIVNEKAPYEEQGYFQEDEESAVDVNNNTVAQFGGDPALGKEELFDDRESTDI